MTVVNSVAFILGIVSNATLPVLLRELDRRWPSGSEGSDIQAPSSTYSDEDGLMASYAATNVKGRSDPSHSGNVTIVTERTELLQTTSEGASLTDSPSADCSERKPAATLNLAETAKLGLRMCPLWFIVSRIPSLHSPKPLIS